MSLVENAKRKEKVINGKRFELEMHIHVLAVLFWSSGRS
jgi:hypothetical protein